MKYLSEAAQNNDSGSEKNVSDDQKSQEVKYQALFMNGFSKHFPLRSQNPCLRCQRLPWLLCLTLAILSSNHVNGTRNRHGSKANCEEKRKQEGTVEAVFGC